MNKDEKKQKESLDNKANEVEKFKNIKKNYQQEGKELIVTQERGKVRP